MARDTGLAVLRGGGGGQIGGQTLPPRFCPGGMKTCAAMAAAPRQLEREVRVVMVGDSGCGKTKLLNRFTRDLYTEVRSLCTLSVQGYLRQVFHYVHCLLDVKVIVCTVIGT